MAPSHDPVQRYEGPARPRVVFVSGCPGWGRKPYDDSSTSMLAEYARRAGLGDLDYGYACVLDAFPFGRKLTSLSQPDLDQARERFRAWATEQTHVNLWVPTDDVALETLTTLRGISKWHLSLLEATWPRGRKVMPLLSPEAIFRSYGDLPFFIFGMSRIAEELGTPTLARLERRFHINPSFEQAVHFLAGCEGVEHLSVDIETREGQITCVGLAPSVTEAMSIPTLPEQWASPEQFFMLWQALKRVTESPALKVGQNFIYDASYFSAYGIAVRALWHDTMLAQRFLNAELPKGLDTIARLYTREPYWKDEGKDWKNVRDYDQFYTYNCKDACVTLEAAFAQRAQMRAQGCEKTFVDLAMSLTPVAAEMSWRGLPQNAEKRNTVRLAKQSEIVSLQAELNAWTQAQAGCVLNPRSPKQVKTYLKGRGLRLPTKGGAETSDMTALLKLQQRYPGEKSLALLVELSERNKMLSSYLNVEPYADGRIRSTFYVNSTETNRWSAGLDPWGRGFNAQTTPSWFKGAFEAPPGWLFVEVDLRQADARVVAWDACEQTLMRFFNEGRDIHRFVASHIFKVDESQVTKPQRQLGKKTGHAANYGMRGPTHSDACLLEMGVVLSVGEAQRMLDAYHALFPAIHVWHLRTQQELRTTRRLTTPFGRTRVFYGRLDDNMFRQAYAFKPSSVVADTINCLLRRLHGARNPERLLHLAQVHDSWIGLVREDYLDEALGLIRDEDSWNPRFALRGGALRIPIEVKVGTNLGQLKEIEHATARPNEVSPQEARS